MIERHHLIYRERATRATSTRAARRASASTPGPQAATTRASARTASHTVRAPTSARTARSSMGGGTTASSRSSSTASTSTAPSPPPSPTPTRSTSAPTTNSLRSSCPLRCKPPAEAWTRDTNQPNLTNEDGKRSASLSVSCTYLYEEATLWAKGRRLLSLSLKRALDPVIMKCQVGVSCRWQRHPQANLK